MSVTGDYSVEVVIEDARWASVGIEELAEKAVSAALSYLSVPHGEVVVLACDDPRIRALNDDFRGKDSATNVLSWPSAERQPEKAGDTPGLPEDGELGDIAIAFDTCEREARAGEKALEDHTLHLLVHATLHLLGYDHERDADGDLMEATETAILKGLGKADPYDRPGD